jgi:hypothetical protein
VSPDGQPPSHHHIMSASRAAVASRLRLQGPPEARVLPLSHCASAGLTHSLVPSGAAWDRSSQRGKGQIRDNTQDGA